MIAALFRSRSTKASYASMSASVATPDRATLNRLTLVDALDRLLAEHAHSDRCVGVLVVRVAVSASSPFSFDPQREDLVIGAALRDGDTAIPITHDEVCVVLPRLSGYVQAELAALKLLRHLSEPLSVEHGDPIAVRAVIGVACSPTNGARAVDLVRSARSAARVAEAKEDAYQIADADGDTVGEDSAQYEAALRTTLQKNGLTLSFQPQLELASGRMISSEALVRWTMTDGRVLSPGVFVPLAERRG